MKNRFGLKTFEPTRGTKTQQVGRTNAPEESKFPIAS